MNDDFKLEFKDQEIAKVTSDITRQSKREFGRTFKSAAEAAEASHGPRSFEGNSLMSSSEPAGIPEGALETVMPTEEEVREQLAPLNAKPTPRPTAYASRPTTQQPTAVAQPQIQPQVEPIPNAAPITRPEPRVATLASAPELAQFSPSMVDDHTPHVAPILSPSTNANDEQKELYAIAKPLRTYERDIADAIREKNESVASINIAAQKKREQTGEKKPLATKAEHSARSGLIILVSILLILASVSFAGIAFYYFAINKPTSIVETNPTIIAIDGTVRVDASNIKNDAAISNIKDVIATPGNPNTLIHVDVVENTSDATGSKKSITVEKLFELFARSAPPALTRALGPEWMLGFQTLAANGSEKINDPFIFVKVSSFDNAFSTMLDWEKDMLKNLAPLLPNPEVVEANSGRRFQDTIIRNKDVRVLKDSYGNVLLMYSFLDSKNLVITTSEHTFREILGRFFSSQIVR